MNHCTQVASNVKPTHVLLLSDPQVQPPHTLWQPTSRTGRFQALVEELHLRKSWHAATRLSPHAIIFLGDMLSDGKRMQTSLE